MRRNRNLYSERPAEIGVGDHIEVVRRHSIFYGQRGEVTDVRDGMVFVDIEDTGCHLGAGMYPPHHLRLVTPPLPIGGHHG